MRKITVDRQFAIRQRRQNIQGQNHRVLVPPGGRHRSRSGSNALQTPRNWTRLLRPSDRDFHIA